MNNNKKIENLEKVVLMKESFIGIKQNKDFVGGCIEFISMVSAYSADCSGNELEKLNKELESKARSLGASHVFGIEYVLTATRYYPHAIVYGDAYKVSR